MAIDVVLPPPYCIIIIYSCLFAPQYVIPLLMVGLYHSSSKLVHPESPNDVGCSHRKLQ